MLSDFIKKVQERNKLRKRRQEEKSKLKKRKQMLKEMCCKNCFYATVEIFSCYCRIKNRHRDKIFICKHFKNKAQVKLKLKLKLINALIKIKMKLLNENNKT